jgi:hypothetical protein
MILMAVPPPGIEPGPSVELLMHKIRSTQPLITRPSSLVSDIGFWLKMYE